MIILEPKNNLNNIKILKKHLKQIGFSDHSLGHELAVASVVIGSAGCRKHFTLSRQDKNPAEHHFQWNQTNLKIW